MLLDRDTVAPTASSTRIRRNRFRKRAAIATCLGIALAVAALAVPMLSGVSPQPKRAAITYTVHAPILIMDDTGFTPANGVTGGTGTPSDPFMIEGWEIDGTSMGVGVLVFGTTLHFVIRNVHAFGTGSIGVELYTAPHGDVLNCLVDSGDMGIALMDCQDSNITGNFATGLTMVGGALLQSSWVNVSENDFSFNSWAGVMMNVVDNVSLTQNFAQNNMMGLMVEIAANMTISGNNASQNSQAGMAMNDAHDVVIEENNLTMNQGWGVYLSNSTEVRVFHNRFIGNGVQAYQENSSAVAWDDGYPSGGNYWSDYSGVDLLSGPGQDQPGSDGIGDTPYLVTTGGQDNYPFMTESMEPIPEFVIIIVPVVGLIVLFVVAGSRRKSRNDLL